LLRDRDRIFGQEVVDQIKSMGINQVLSAPRSPWQRAYRERVIGTIRRECLDHVIVRGERSLSGHLQGFVDYYHQSRTHLRFGEGLSGASPDPIGANGTRGCDPVKPADSIIVTSATPPKGIFGAIPSARLCIPARPLWTVTGSALGKRREGRCPPATPGE
jgi:hypothetical protein